MSSPLAYSPSVRSLIGFVFVLLGLSLPGCKLFKNIGKEKDSEALGLALAREIQAEALTFEELNFSGKAQLQLPEESEFGQNISLSYRIQVVRDSAILIRVSKLIELAKVLIRPDSVLVLDKLNQHYYACDYELAQKYTGLESSFEVLQALLLGDYQPIPEQMHLTSVPKTNPLILAGTYQETAMSYYLDRELRKLVRIHAERAADSTNTDIYYHNFQPQGDQQVPMEISISVGGEPDVLQLIHRKLTFSNNSGINFSIPDGFTRQDCPE